MSISQDRPFEIIVLGPPVSGKGTQAELLAKTFDIPHISTGQILHSIKDDIANPLAQKVAEFMNAGSLVPDELVNQLVADRIKKDDCVNGFILDGYPRTLSQAQAIDAAVKLDYVFLVNVSDETIIERISGRRVCKNGHVWHIKYSPPKTETVCDDCGEPLFLRDDDKSAVVKNRLEIFHQNMAPIIEFYERAGILIRIDGEKHIEEVFQQFVRHMIYDLRNKVNRSSGGSPSGTATI
ncbi:MAG TPA: nucleoside monophosphate kinase [bacterium]|nr:nucleoside monophosphate kinase [bacterium]